MVDLGQKGGSNSTFLFLTSTNHKKSGGYYLTTAFLTFSFLYFSVTYLRETSDQLITLKKASI
jgi:hypothetical protein